MTSAASACDHWLGTWHSAKPCLEVTRKLQAFRQDSCLSSEIHAVQQLPRLSLNLIKICSVIRKSKQNVFKCLQINTMMARLGKMWKDSDTRPDQLSFGWCLPRPLFGLTPFNAISCCCEIAARTLSMGVLGDKQSSSQACTWVMLDTWLLGSGWGDNARAKCIDPYDWIFSLSCSTRQS